ncbi:MAG: 16S rRNA (cytosine(1402)-N(4))-methyltransferase RsmH [Bacteroidota bacterium]
MSYHDPVLLSESIEGLEISQNGVYVDATFGGGGHSKAILNAIGQEGRLYAFDQDEDAANNRIGDNRLIFILANFRHLKRFLKLNGIRKVNGILADLGVSSFQLDKPQRGFSYRYEAKLDMRMDKEGPLTAADIVNTYDAGQLQQLLSKYGEVRNAKTVAQALVSATATKKIKTTGDLLMILDPLVRGNRARYLAQVFQALRIEVNDEMGALEDFLSQSLEVLQPGGRLVVISYHSLEDRMVKNFVKKGTFDGQVIKDDYGNIYRPFKEVVKKTILPSQAEIDQNPRARSAKLRIAEKLLIE